jgi:CRISPR-associated exonuclease Cas4
VSVPVTPTRLTAGVTDPLPLSALNDFLFCPRRAWLKFVEGLRGENEHTIIGDLAHEHVDFPGFEQRAGWTLLRALPVFSDRLGLSGKADLVEVRFGKSQISDLKSKMPCVAAARPVEYKKGPKRRFDNDEVQLCAQALCMEEMFGLTVEAGAIFYVQSQRRLNVPFDAALRALTLRAISDLKSLISNPAIPPAELKPQCEGCSLHEVCLPELARSASAWRSAEGRLFMPVD